MARSSVDFPVRGDPTTATWPAALERSARSISRFCSRGMSTVPSGNRSGPRERQEREISPSSGSTARSGSIWSKVSGTSSGGSQTRWAAGPCPVIPATAMSKTVRFSSATATADSSAARDAAASSCSSRETTSPGTNGRASRRAVLTRPPAARRMTLGGPDT